MKRIFGLLAGIIMTTTLLMAQTPDAFKYQAVARDAAGVPLTDANVSVRIGILPGSESSTAIYSESFSLVTNSFGLFTIEVGKGTVIIGDFSTIDWSAAIYFLKVELAMDGSSFFLSGASQLLSVPYALHAKKADNSFSGDYMDLSNSPDWSDSIASSVFSGDYMDLSNSPDWSDSIASSVFSGDYMDLSNSPDWSDSIAAYTDGMIIPEGVVESGNMLTYDGNNWVAKDIISENTGSGEPISIMQPFQVVNYCIALVGVYPSRNIVEPFIGTIAAFGFNFAPRNWASCDGQLLSIASNTALFSLLGTIYGGDGRVTFGLPDLRGRTLLHMGEGAGLTNRPIGQKQGSESIIIPVGALPAHNHIITFE